MDKVSRLRGPNFTSSDSSLLCDIIAKHKHIIENKKTDGANLVQKQKAWLEVMEEFNAITNGHNRSVESLQQNYKNLKKKAKKSISNAKMDIPVDRAFLIKNIEEYGTSEGWDKVAEQTGTSKENCQQLFNIMNTEVKVKEKTLKKNILGTGGGPPPKFNDDPILDKVKGLVGSTIEGLYTIYDGDSSIMKLQNVTPIEIKNVIIDDNVTPHTKSSVNTDEQPSTSAASVIMTPKSHLTQDDLSPYFTNNRANLRKKPHDLLTRKRKLESEVPEKTSVSDKFKLLAMEKMEYISMQKEVLKLQLVEEQEKLEHNRALRAMELEDAKAKYVHNEKMRKLELDKICTLNKQI